MSRPACRRRTAFLSVLGLAGLLLGVGVSLGANRPALPAPTDLAPPLSFRIDQGDESNRFVRVGPIAAHLVLRAGRAPRLLVVFPADDSGIGVWFEPGGIAARWQVAHAPQPISARDAHGRLLRGAAIELRLMMPRLQVRQVLLSSVRVLRDYEASGVVPEAVRTPVRWSAQTVSWSRDRLDGAAGYRLVLQGLQGTRFNAGTLRAGSDGVLHVRLLALCGAQPLNPVGGAALWNARAQPDQREREVLSFLSYRQKYLAGSWRFDTYFGRDTLISLMLLAPVLQPTAVDSGIDSVLARLSGDGEVAHEEAIGEYAVLLNQAAGRGRSDTPVYDYGMLDENFLLAPVLAHWWLDEPAGRARAAQFLAAGTDSGDSRGARVMRNLRFVIRRTAAFARAPTFHNLVGLKPGQRAGDWRDSPDGLDEGQYPYDVNVALVPAALAAITRLGDSGLLTGYLRAGDRELLAEAARQLQVWSREAAPLFAVRVGAKQAAVRVESYASALGLSAFGPVAALQGAPVQFEALALDANGRALPVMHSDESFALLLDDLSAAQLQQALQTLFRPFPAGLYTPVGLLVANPAYTDGAAQTRFTSAAYHGTVIWSWQQAVLAAGLQRQLSRVDLPAPLHAQLQQARSQLWAAIGASRALRSAELWSWSYQRGHYRPEPFQPASGEAEADAAQLWSTLYLALAPPSPARSR